MVKIVSFSMAVIIVEFREGVGGYGFLGGYRENLNPQAQKSLKRAFWVRF
jgi:hypothetical protein